MKKIIPIFIAFICIFSCSEEPAETPEEVVRTWQSYMDQNKFEAAKKLSTASGKKVITDIEVLLNMDNEPIPVDTTEFITMTCIENGNKAICRYSERIKEEYFRRGDELVKVEEEILTDSFLLKKIDGKWLIDLPEEPIDDNDHLNELFNDLLEEENS